MKISTIAVLALATLPAAAHDPISTKLTWNRDISPLIRRHCFSCHRPNAQAPMPLLTWQQARPWAVSISEEVRNRRMPPWGAVEGFGEFTGTPGLSQDEIQQIAAWAAGGAPEGPPLPSPQLPPQHRPTRPPGRRLTLQSTLALTHPLSLLAIRPGPLPAQSSFQVIAERPDGSIEPLLWLRYFRPRFVRDYVFRRPVMLPKGSRLRTVPAGGVFQLTWIPQ